MIDSTDSNSSVESGTSGPLTADHSAVLNWIELVHPADADGYTNGLIHICATGNWEGRTFVEPADAAAFVMQLDREGREGIYMRTTTLASVPKEYKRGSDEDSKILPGFAADMDIAGPGHKTTKPLPASVEQCRAIIAATNLPEPTLWVHSGGGVYPWWLLEDGLDLTTPNALEWAQDMSAKLHDTIARWAEHLGMFYGSGVKDMSRVLRIPGTVNRKKDCVPAMAHVIQPASYDFYSIDFLKDKIDEAHAAAPVPKAVEAPRPAPAPRADGVLTPGDDFNNRAHWADILTPHGWTYMYHRGSTMYWRRPGKESGEHSATTGRKGIGSEDRLYCFTDATEFEQNVPYNKHAAYCVAPETQILMADLTWKQAADVANGDTLVGVDEFAEGKNARRKLRPSVVEGVERRILPCYRVDLEDGRSLVCTDEHPWLATSAGKGNNMRWIQAQNLRPGQRICSLTDGTWTRDGSFDSGWLSGMYDGEGWFSGTTLGIAQKEGPILDRAESLLRERGFNVTRSVRPTGVGNLVINDLPSIMRALGTLQPGRLIDKMAWVGRGAWTRVAKNAIVKQVSFLGDREVAAFTTSTRTFIAEGLVSHNTLLNHGGLGATHFASSTRDLRGQGFGGDLPKLHDARDTVSLVRPAAQVPVAVQAVNDEQPAQAALVVQADKALPVLGHDGLPEFTTDVYSSQPWDDMGLVSMYSSAFCRGLRYVNAMDEWRVWDGQRWVRDDLQLHQLASRKLATGLRDQARKLEAEGHEFAKEMKSAAGKLATMGKVMSLPKLARTDRCMSSTPRDYDSHKYLVTVENGVLNLKTGQLSDFDPDLMLTKKIKAVFDPDAQGPRTTAFLNEIQPDPAVLAYMQRLVGATVLGNADERVLPIIHGASGSGKSAFLEMLYHVLADFAAVADPTTLMPQPDNYQGPSEKLHALMGTRFVKMSELPENASLNQALVKSITGSDTQKTRPLYGHPVEWQVEYVVWMATNNLPKITSTDGAIWKRVKPIHFPNVFVNEDGSVKSAGDRDLGRQLAREEGSFILNWILRGIVEYLDKGLDEPAQIGAWLTGYRDEMDTTRQFMAEAQENGQLKVEQGQTIPARDLYKVYLAWAADAQVRFPLSAQTFKQRMQVNGYEHTRVNTGMVWSGIGICGFIGQAQTPAQGNQWMGRMRN